MAAANQSHTMAFRVRVADCLAAAPPILAGDADAQAAVQAMRDAGASSVAVTDGNGRIAGIVTEQDVVRRAAFQVEPTLAVSEIMTAPVQVIRHDDLLFHAIARMRRAGLRHMPVVDDADRVVGVLTLDAALAAVAPQLMVQIERLTGPPTSDGLAQVRAAQIDVAADLLADGVPAPDIQGLLTHINNDIYGRVADDCVARLAADGWGPPPRPFCLLVLGSGGRGENYLNPDQDNALIIADYPDAEHDRIDGYFRAFAERLTQAMDGVGMPLCKGNVMVTNPVWRKTLSQWRDQIDYWIRRRNLVTLRLSDIFFDFRPIHGAHHLGVALREHVTARLKGNKTFVRAMYEKDEDFGVALGLFNRFIVERDVAEHRGELNLKINATLPLVDATRALSLLHGMPETSTRGRIDALHAAGVLSDNEADYLTGAFRHITGLMMRSQMSQQRAGRPVSNYVHPDSLSRRERDMLVDSLKAIRSLRERLRSELTGELF